MKNKKWLAFMGSAVVIALILSAMEPAYADWFGDAVNNAVKNTGTKAVNEGADAVYNGAKESATKKNTPNNNSANDSTGSTSAPAATATNTGNAAAGGADVQNEAAYNKFDFIPGDKVIFFDDFSDTDIGEFPRKWKITTPDGSYGHTGAALEVISYGGQNHLLCDGTRGVYCYAYPRLAIKGDMPEKFTIEFDAALISDSQYESNGFVLFTNKNNSYPYFGISINGTDASSSHSKSSYTLDKTKKVHHISISVNGTFVKAYVDNMRVVNDPEGLERPITLLGIQFSGPDVTAKFTNFKVAEGGKNIKSAINTDGKIITHGILFAPGSDQIKPESAATLRMIFDILNGDPNLKFSIEGHTDNQGSSSTSQPLSEKRAIAVKNWLVAKGIDTSRLQAKGWGEAKPIDSNATKEGQANNRRVEFIKI